MIRSCGKEKPKWRIAVILWHRQAQVKSSCFIGTFGKSIEPPYLWLLKVYRYLLTLWTNNSKQYKNWKPPWQGELKLLNYCILFYILYCHTVLLTIGALDTLRMISVEASDGRFYKRLRHFTNAWSVFSIRCRDIFMMLICFFYFCICQLLMVFLQYLYW